MIKLDDSRLRRAVSDILDTAPEAPDAPLNVGFDPSRHRHYDLVAAAVIVGIGVAGVAVISDRQGPSPNASSGTTTVPVTTAPRKAFIIPADGRMVFDPAPEGASAPFASRDHHPSGDETRVYVESDVTAEQGAAVFVTAGFGTALPDRDSFDDIPVQDVTVQSVPGIAFREMNAERVTFGPVDGVIYSLDGYGLTREDLLTIAAGARFEDTEGATIDPEALGPAMSELAVGSYNETSVFTPSTSGGDVAFVQASWASPDHSRYLGYVVTAEFGEMFVVNRVGHDGVRDVDVAGLDGYVWTNEYPSGIRDVGLAMSDGSRTIFVTANGYTEPEVIALAETLRPATDGEWSAMLLAGEQLSGELNAPPQLGTEG